LALLNEHVRSTFQNSTPSASSHVTVTARLMPASSTTFTHAGESAAFTAQRVQHNSKVPKTYKIKEDCLLSAKFFNTELFRGHPENAS
jgi:hypothetical protein